MKMHLYINIYVYIHTCTYTHTCIGDLVRDIECTYMHVYTYIHTHTCVYDIHFRRSFGVTPSLRSFRLALPPRHMQAITATTLLSSRLAPPTCRARCRALWMPRVCHPRPSRLLYNAQIFLYQHINNVPESRSKLACSLWIE